MIRDLVKRFGGLTRMSMKTGIPIPTIQHWQDVNRIPHWRLCKIKARAQECGFDLAEYMTEEPICNEKSVSGT